MSRRSKNVLNAKNTILSFSLCYYLILQIFVEKPFFNGFSLFVFFCYEQTSPPRRNGRYCRICFANIDVVALFLLSHSEHAYATTLNGVCCDRAPKKSVDFLGRRRINNEAKVFRRKHKLIIDLTQYAFGQPKNAY